MNAKTTQRDLAAGYAEAGFFVFPLAANSKAPALAENWKDIATNEPKRAARMWTRHTSGAVLDYNIAICTGTPIHNGFLVVIDVDVSDGKPGRSSLAELEADHGTLPPTLTVCTSRGGEHRYFISPHPLGNSQSKIGPGLDVKGQNGYVVAPGSTVNGGEYTVSNPCRIAALPAAFVELCGRPKKKTQVDRAIPLVDWDQEHHTGRAIEWLEEHAPPNGTYHVACHVRGFGISQEKCLDLMLEHWRDRLNLDKDDAHIAFRVANAYSYGQDPPGILCAEAEFDAVEVDTTRTANPPTGAWQDPADLWEQDHAPQDIPSDVVPAYVARFARDRARRLGVDEGAMTAAAVTALSSLVPAANDLHMRQHSNSWPVKAILWLAIVGDPGTAKSPTVAAAMEFPRAVEREWLSEFAKAQEKFELSQPADTSQRQKRRRGRVTAVPAETAPPIAEQKETPAQPFPDAFEIEATAVSEPKLRRKIVNDATTEALAGVLAANPESAPALFYSDELAGVIGGLDAYRARGAKDRPFFLSAKDGGAFAIDRKSSGTTLVPSLAISIIGTIQDDKLSKIAPTLDDDGFLQRFALVMIHKTGGGLDIPDDLDLDRSVKRVALALADMEPQAYRLAPEADKDLQAAQEFVERERHRPDLSPALKTWISKTPSEFGRYCLAFHLIEWASSLDAALGEPPALMVPRETANRARRYVQEFLYSHAKYIYGTVMAKGQDDADAQWVASYILTRSLATITAREIGRAYRSLRGPQNRAKLKSVMATLAIQDWVKVTNDARGAWKINPAVHDGRFDVIKTAEAKRRDAVKKAIAATVEAIRSARGIG